MKEQTKNEMLWKVSKEQEERFKQILLDKSNEIQEIDIDEVFKLIRSAEYRRGKEEQKKIHEKIMKEFVEKLKERVEYIQKDYATLDTCDKELVLDEIDKLYEESEIEKVIKECKDKELGLARAYVEERKSQLLKDIEIHKKIMKEFVEKLKEDLTEKTWNWLEVQRIIDKLYEEIKK